MGTNSPLKSSNEQPPLLAPSGNRKVVGAVEPAERQASEGTNHGDRQEVTSAEHDGQANGEKVVLDEDDKRDSTSSLQNSELASLGNAMDSTRVWVMPEPTVMDYTGAGAPSLKPLKAVKSHPETRNSGLHERQPPSDSIQPEGDSSTLYHPNSPPPQSWYRDNNPPLSWFQIPDPSIFVYDPDRPTRVTFPTPTIPVFATGVGPTPHQKHAPDHSIYVHDPSRPREIPLRDPSIFVSEPDGPVPVYHVPQPKRQTSKGFTAHDPFRTFAGRKNLEAGVTDSTTFDDIIEENPLQPSIPYHSSAQSLLGTPTGGVPKFKPHNLGSLERDRTWSASGYPLPQGAYIPFQPPVSLPGTPIAAPHNQPYHLPHQSWAPQFQAYTSRPLHRVPGNHLSTISEHDSEPTPSPVVPERPPLAARSESPETTSSHSTYGGSRDSKESLPPADMMVLPSFSSEYPHPIYGGRVFGSNDNYAGSKLSNPGRILKVYHTFLRYTTREIPKEAYNILLLHLPSLYFSRVARIFEEADLGLGEIKNMALETGLKSKAPLIEPFALETQNAMLPVYSNLKLTWERFIDSVMREWKTFNIISVLLLSAILTILQIESAASDALTRYSALASLLCALTSLLYGCMYIIRFGTMRKTYKAAEWALEAKKSNTAIFWNVWVLLAMPAVWLSWSLVLYIFCIMSFLWRTSTSQIDDHNFIATGSLLAIRIVISVVLVLGMVYGALILSTFRRYGEVMDDAWKRRINGWIDTNATLSAQYKPRIQPHGNTDTGYPQAAPSVRNPSFALMPTQCQPWLATPRTHHFHSPSVYDQRLSTPQSHNPTPLQGVVPWNATAPPIIPRPPSRRFSIAPPNVAQPLGNPSRRSESPLTTFGRYPRRQGSADSQPFIPPYTGDSHSQRIPDTPSIVASLDTPLPVYRPGARASFESGRRNPPSPPFIPPLSVTPPPQDAPGPLKQRPFKQRKRRSPHRRPFVPPLDSPPRQGGYPVGHVLHNSSVAESPRPATEIGSEPSGRLNSDYDLYTYTPVIPMIPDNPDAPVLPPQAGHLTPGEHEHYHADASYTQYSMPTPSGLSGATLPYYPLFIPPQYSLPLGFTSTGDHGYPVGNTIVDSVEPIRRDSCPVGRDSDAVPVRSPALAPSVPSSYTPDYYPLLSTPPPIPPPTQESYTSPNPPTPQQLYAPSSVEIGVEPPDFPARYGNGSPRSSFSSTPSSPRGSFINIIEVPPTPRSTRCSTNSDPNPDSTDWQNRQPPSPSSPPRALPESQDGNSESLSVSVLPPLDGYASSLSNFPAFEPVGSRSPSQRGGAFGGLDSGGESDGVLGQSTHPSSPSTCGDDGLDGGFENNQTMGSGGGFVDPQPRKADQLEG